MHGPTQRDKDGVCYRKDGNPHPGSKRSKNNTRDTAYFLRITQTEFRYIEALIIELGFRSRADLVIHAVTLLALIAKGAQETDYRDREEFAADSIQALNCLLRRAPIPSWAALEPAPVLLPPPAAEPSKP